MSIVTEIINDLSGVVVNGALMGGVGYLFGRMVKQIDPKAAFICGAVTGIIHALFTVPYLEGKTKKSTNLIGLAAFIFAPMKACQKMNTPITLQASLAISVASTMSIAAVVYLQEQFSGYNREASYRRNRNYF